MKKIWFIRKAIFDTNEIHFQFITAFQPSYRIPINKIKKAIPQRIPGAFLAMLAQLLLIALTIDKRISKPQQIPHAVVSDISDAMRIKI